MPEMLICCDENQEDAFAVSHVHKSGKAERISTGFWKRSIARLIWAGLLSCSFALIDSTAQAQEVDELATRPSANRILPEETLLYLRVRSFPDFIATFEETGMAKMFGDERVAPLVNDIYGNLKQEYDERVKEELDGVELEQFKDFFAGEFCFALVAKRRKNMEGILICDVNPESETASKLLGVAKAKAEENGEEVATEAEGEIEIEIIRGGERDLHYFRVENTIYLSTNRDLCAEMIGNMNGEPLEKARPFIENRKYRTIMGHCKIDKNNPPLMTFFVDPIELFKAATRGEAVAQMAMGVLPVIGLDGLSAIGGASIPGDETYQSLSHVHILMASPRKGMLEAVSFRPGAYQLSSVIPNDVAVAMSTSLDVPRFYGGIQTIVDTFSGEGTVENGLERASEEIDINIKEEIIDALTGDVTLVTWPNPESDKFNGTTNGYLIGLHDEEAAKETMNKLLDLVRERDENAIAEDSHNGIDYFYVAAVEQQMERGRERQRERWKELDEDERDRRERQLDITSKFARAPVPAFAIFDNQIVISDSVEFLKRFIDTYKGKLPQLNNSEDYRLVRETAEKYLDGQKPSGVMFSRPMSQLGPIWRAIKSDGVKDLLKMGADDEDSEMSGFAGRMLESMEKNELPDIEELEQYFNTSGGFMTDDETGLHFFFFDLKPEVTRDMKK